MANFSININKKLYEAVIGETVSKGDILYLGTDHKWYLAAAGLKSKSTTELAIALDDGVENDEIDLLAYGYHTYTNSLFLPGTKYYLSIVSGKSTADRYENNDYTLRYVGTAFSDKILLFNPDQTYISDRGTRVNDVEFGGGGGGIVFTTDESLYLDPITNELRANLTTTIDTFDYLSGEQEFTLTETPVRMLYVWVQGVGLVKKNIQYEVDEVNKKLTILDELEGGEVITACYHNVINESVTPFVTDVQVENKDLDVFKNESADPYVRVSEVPPSGVQTVTGDGVGGTPEDVVLTFPTPAEIGAIEEIFFDYTDTAGMVADQANQTDQAVYVVADASDDTNITFSPAETKLQAFYRYNGVATGSIDDYTLISAPYAQADGTIETEDTADIILTGDGTDANKLKATLQPTPNSTDIFGRTNDHWKPVVRRMEEDGVEWVEVLSPNGDKLLQYSTQYFDEDTQELAGRNTLLNTRFGVKTLKGQIDVNAIGFSAAQLSKGNDINAIGYTAAHNSQGDNINAIGYEAAQGSQGNNINAIGFAAAQGSQGDNINAIGYEAAQGSQGNDINVFGRSSYNLPGNLKCDRVNIFGPNIQPTKSDQNIISGHEFLMPSSTASTVMAGGPKSLTTLETVEEMIGNTQGFTTQLIDTGGNYNNLEVTADLLVFTNENAQAILNGIWGRKEFHILNLSSQYEILINHDSSSVSGNGQPIMLPTNSGTAGIKGTARVLQTDSYGYFVADTWGSKYRPEFAEVTEDKVMLVGADHRAKAEDIIELKFYRTNQSTAMDSAELENNYPDSIQGTEVICTPINKKYEKIDNLGNWIEIDFITA